MGNREDGGEIGNTMGIHDDGDENGTEMKDTDTLMEPSVTASNNNAGCSSREEVRSAPSTKKTSYRYKMPSVYANYLKNAVLSDINLKRGLARNMMIVAMGWEGKQLPSDFPTEEQVKTRVSGLKYTHSGAKQRNKSKKKGVPAE